MYLAARVLEKRPWNYFKYFMNKEMEAQSALETQN